MLVKYHDVIKEILALIKSVVVYALFDRMPARVFQKYFFDDYGVGVKTPNKTVDPSPNRDYIQRLMDSKKIKF